MLIVVDQVAGDSGASSSKADVASPEDSSSLTSAPEDAPPPPSAPGDAPPPTDQPKQEEEESDLQLSWEVLELARLICQRSVGLEVANNILSSSFDLKRV